LNPNDCLANSIGPDEASELTVSLTLDVKLDAWPWQDCTKVLKVVTAELIYHVVPEINPNVSAVKSIF
jgi:hypothetical protein